MRSFFSNFTFPATVTLAADLPREIGLLHVRREKDAVASGRFVFHGRPIRAQPGVRRPTRDVGGFPGSTMRESNRS